MTSFEDFLRMRNPQGLSPATAPPAFSGYGMGQPMGADDPLLPGMDPALMAPPMMAPPAMAPPPMMAPPAMPSMPSAPAPPPPPIAPTPMMGQPQQDPGGMFGSPLYDGYNAAADRGRSIFAPTPPPGPGMGPGDPGLGGMMPGMGMAQMDPAGEQAVQREQAFASHFPRAMEAMNRTGLWKGGSDSAFRPDGLGRRPTPAGRMGGGGGAGPMPTRGGGGGGRPGGGGGRGSY